MGNQKIRVPYSAAYGCATGGVISWAITGSFKTGLLAAVTAFLVTLLLCVLATALVNKYGR